VSLEPPQPSHAHGTATLRDARADDLPAIVAIYNSTIAGRQVTADLEPVTLESRSAWFAAHEPRRRPLWVLEEQRGQKPTVIGWLSLSDFYGRPAYQGTAEVSIYLAAEARGHGHGGWLLERAMEFAPHAGVSTMLGFIFGHNAPSLELFRRRGFEPWGTLPRVARLDDDERDLVIVGRRLD
jgi:L-amino acid N-acyltransferase YncA